MSQREQPKQRHEAMEKPAVCTGLQGIQCEAEEAEDEAGHGGRTQFMASLICQAEKMGFFYPKGSEKPMIGF